jgi:hypothetical protein
MGGVHGLLLIRRLESCFLPSNNKVDVAVVQSLECILFVFRELVFLLIVVQLHLEFGFHLFEFNQRPHQECIQVLDLLLFFIVGQILSKLILWKIYLVDLYYSLHLYFGMF